MRGQFYFTGRELKELALSALAITLIFAWPVRLTPDWVILFGLFLLFVGVGFACHEVAHKLAAQSLGARSEFVIWKPGLVFALLMRVIGGPVFIAPRATVWSKRRATQQDMGKVALAGPITNMVLALAFVGLSLVAPVMAYGALVNLKLAFFNLLPIPPLDGADILRWNKAAWLAAFLASIGMQIWLLF